MITVDKAISQAIGLTPEDKARLEELLQIFEQHQSKNAKKRRYYEGHIPLSEVNLGLALPSNIAGLEIGCAWGTQVVDVLASRSRFDGFVGSSGEPAAALMAICAGSRLIPEYTRAVRDELKFGCTFATLSADPVHGASIRFHSPETAAAVWSGVHGRIDYGFAIIDSRKDEKDKVWRPALINMYTDKAVVVLQYLQYAGRWVAEYHPHKMGRPLMEALVWSPTSAKPLGRSRLKEPIRELIKGYVRTVANATIGLEFATSPQKYLLGITDEQYDAIISSKFKTYVGSLLAATNNPETGTTPTFGQLSQGTIEPHIQMMRLLSTQLSAATGLSVTDVGVVNDANPSSSDAILAQSQTLVLLAEQLNAGNAAALHTIALMAQAIAGNKTLDELTDEEKDVAAHYRNPAMPSLASTADAALKIATSRPAFGQTDVYLEMIGFDVADIRRIKAQEARARGLGILDEIGMEVEEKETK